MSDRKLQTAMLLTTTIKGNTHQLFLDQQNALGLHPEGAGGVLNIHECDKAVCRVIENSFCTEEVPITLSSENSSQGIKYMDPISEVLYRNFTITNCNLLYTNALELQIG